MCVVYVDVLYCAYSDCCSILCVCACARALMCVCLCIATDHCMRNNFFLKEKKLCDPLLDYYLCMNSLDIEWSLGITVVLEERGFSFTCP